MMDGWVFRPGYPLVRVHREGAELVLHQQRFSYLPAGEESAEEQPPWVVPVQLRLHTDRGAGGSPAVVQRVLLSEQQLRLPLPVGTDAVLVNEGGHGFYRVSYERGLLERLLDRLADGMAAIERFNLVNDAWALVLAGLMPLTEYLDLTMWFKAERDRNVWSVLLGSFHMLQRILSEEDREGLQGLVRDRLGPAIADLGWQPRAGEFELTGQLRGELLRALGTLGDDPATQAEARRIFAAMEEGQAVDPSVLSAAVAILAHTGDVARYEDYLGRFRTARTPQEEQRYLLALAGFRQEELVQRTLASTLNGEVRTQDAPLLLRAMLYGVHSRGPAWRFLQTNWERMNATFPVVGVRRMCEGVQGLATPEWEEEVRSFFRERGVDLGGKTLEQYLEQLHIAVRLRQREGGELGGYLRK
jgi:puromycin-sensitive aminopeptidase